MCGFIGFFNVSPKSDSHIQHSFIYVTHHRNTYVRVSFNFIGLVDSQQIEYERRKDRQTRGIL